MHAGTASLSMSLKQHYNKCKEDGRALTIGSKQPLTYDIDIFRTRAPNWLKAPQDIQIKIEDRKYEQNNHKKFVKFEKCVKYAILW